MQLFTSCSYNVVIITESQILTEYLVSMRWSQWPELYCSARLHMIATHIGTIGVI